MVGQQGCVIAQFVKDVLRLDLNKTFLKRNFLKYC